MSAGAAESQYDNNEADYEVMDEIDRDEDAKKKVRFRGGVAESMAERGIEFWNQTRAKRLKARPDPVCANCNANPAEGLKFDKCTGCSSYMVTVRYCSKACQNDDWPRHKLHCRGRVAGQYPSRCC